MSSSSPNRKPDEVFTIFDRRYRIQRYPRRHREELKGWDTADHYLLETAFTEIARLDHSSSEPLSICVLHDVFGAITIPLIDQLPHHVISYGDSWMSRRAIEINLQENSISRGYSFETSFDRLVDLHPPPSLVIGRVPKSSAQLAYLLQRLHKWLKPNTLLLLAGMDKHLSRGQYQLLEERFGPSSFMPGVKRARVWRAVNDPSLQPPEEGSPLSLIDIPDHQLQLAALPNVFSRDQLDLGSRFFLSQLDRLPRCVDVADLACGSGVLGLAYLTAHPDARLYFCDESFQAVDSTRYNLTMNHLAANAEVCADDGLKQRDASSLDLVLCNPPFHHNHTVSTDLARSLFRDAHRALRAGGQLWVVANRHLAYSGDLSRLFKRCATIASNKKFIILCATR